jgi:hypothetical protein
MWKWFNCYLSGRHDFGVWCESGTVFLRCVHCGRRSSGWAVHTHAQPASAPARTVNRASVVATTSRVVAFERRAS